jgi:hypothetical protein
VPAATGVIYCNQVGGLACVHRALEGYLVPLPRVDDDVFSPEWWERHYNRRVAGDEGDWQAACRRIEHALAGLLSSGERPEHIEVVPHPENEEAWVHVVFDLPELGESGNDDEVVRLRGVLTWENCD